METVRQQIFAALRAIRARLLLPPDATPAEMRAAIVDAYALATDALPLEQVFSTDAEMQAELEARELPE